MNKENSVAYTILPKIVWWPIAIIGTPILFLSMVKSLEQKAIQHDLITTEIKLEHWQQNIAYKHQENTLTNDIINNEKKDDNIINHKEKEPLQQKNYLTINTAGSKQDKNLLSSASICQCNSGDKSKETLLHIAALPLSSTINGIKALKAFKEQKIAVKTTVSNCQKRLNSITQNNKILFTSGHSKIHLQSYPMLDKIATVITECETVLLHNILTINGHTDSRGEKSYNKLLSESRANSVKKYLTKQNINTKQMVVIGYGETKPISNNHTKKGRIENRRITFEFKRENSILSKL
jgi:outer membrane protein OmpA-like peptidoglycan-associated protein